MKSTMHGHKAWVLTAVALASAIAFAALMYTARIGGGSANAQSTGSTEAQIEAKAPQQAQLAPDPDSAAAEGLPERPPVQAPDTKTDSARAASLVATAEAMFPSFTTEVSYERVLGIDWNAYVAMKDSNGNTVEITVGGAFPDEMNGASEPGAIASNGRRERVYARTDGGQQVTIVVTAPPRQPAPSLATLLAASRPSDPGWATSPASLEAELRNIGSEIAAIQ